MQYDIIKYSLRIRMTADICLEVFDFTDKEVYQQYLYRIFAIRDMNASIDTTAQVGTDDKILTLSTCYANQPDMRFLVQAVLVSIEQ